MVDNWTSIGSLMVFYRSYFSAIFFLVDRYDACGRTRNPLQDEENVNPLVWLELKEIFKYVQFIFALFVGKGRL